MTDSNRLPDGQVRSEYASMSAPTAPTAHTQQQGVSIGNNTNVVSQEYPFVMSSTPPISTCSTSTDGDAEDELFEGIERLIRDFLGRPNRCYPYYRILRWALEEEPTLSFSAVVVVNRPTALIDD